MLKVISSVTKYKEIDVLTCIVSQIPQGFGSTIGNSIRRTVLSNTPGLSVYGFKCNCFKHPFDRSIHIREDADEVSTNLKDLIILYDPEVEELCVTVTKKGPCIITGKDIQQEAGERISIINLDKEILSVSDDSEVTLEIYINHGTGFIINEENRDKKQDDEAFIGVTAIYSRIEKTNFTNNINDIVNSQFEELTITVEYVKCYVDNFVIESAVQQNIDMYKNLLLALSTQSVVMSEGFEKMVLDVAYNEPSHDLYHLLETLKFNSYEELEQQLQSTELLKNAKIKKKQVKDFLQKINQFVTNETQ